MNLDYFNYDGKAGKIYWKMKPSNMANRVNVGEEAGYYCNGYKVVTLFGEKCRVHRLIWKIETGEYPKGEIDHINGITDDNRISNLRDVNRKTNHRNTKMRIDNTSGQMGVSYCNWKNKWEVRICGDFLGRFENKEEAIAVRKEAEIKYGFHKNHGRNK